MQEPIVTCEYYPSFTFETPDGMQYRFDITKALIIAEGKPVNANILTLDILRSECIKKVDPVYAMTTDCTKPVIFAPLLDDAGEVIGQCMIDGWHRGGKAILTGLRWIGGYLLTVEETKSIMCPFDEVEFIQYIIDEYGEGKMMYLVGEVDAVRTAIGGN